MADIFEKILDPKKPVNQDPSDKNQPDKDEGPCCTWEHRCNCQEDKE